MAAEQGGRWPASGVDLARRATWERRPRGGTLLVPSDVNHTHRQPGPSRVQSESADSLDQRVRPGSTLPAGDANDCGPTHDYTPTWGGDFDLGAGKRTITASRIPEIRIAAELRQIALTPRQHRARMTASCRTEQEMCAALSANASLADVRRGNCWTIRSGIGTRLRLPRVAVACWPPLADWPSDGPSLIGSSVSHPLPIRFRSIDSDEELLTR